MECGPRSPAEEVGPARSVPLVAGADEVVLDPVAVGVGDAGHGPPEVAELPWIGGDEGADQRARSPTVEVSLAGAVEPRPEVSRGVTDEEVPPAVAVGVLHASDFNAEAAKARQRVFQGEQEGTGGTTEEVGPVLPASG